MSDNYTPTLTGYDKPYYINAEDYPHKYYSLYHIAYIHGLTLLELHQLNPQLDNNNFTKEKPYGLLIRVR